MYNKIIVNENTIAIIRLSPRMYMYIYFYNQHCKNNSCKTQYLTLATFGSSDMSTTHRKLSLSQMASSSNANQTICQPINWDLILAKTAPKWTPRSVRSYLNTVCERLNAHFAYIMSGKDIGKIQVTRSNRIPGEPPVKVHLSFWRMQQMFPSKISIRWTENEKPMSLHMSAFEIWSKSRIRREIQPVASMPNQPPDIAVQWLTQMLALPREACPIEFDRPNVRQHIYDAWHEFVGKPDDWSPKRISESIYRVLPTARPRRGHRERLRGISVMHIPSQDECRDMIAQTQTGALRF